MVRVEGVGWSEFDLGVKGLSFSMPVIFGLLC
jgi:hypothetical protein